VIDLRTGEIRPGKPEDLITMGVPVDFPADCRNYIATGQDSPCPGWEAFIQDIMDGNRRMAEYLCRLFGYGVTGLIIENIFVILFGHGRNGKSLLIETLQKVLGPLAGPIPAEMLLDQGRVRNSAGPSPDIISLRGRRLVFASETEQNHRFASSKVKWLSGGDSLTGRAPHDRDVSTFTPTHLLCLASNFKPKANSEDRPFWLRMHLIEFNLSFVAHPSAPNERPVDRTLGERLAAEASGILAWLVRGCLLWQLEGLNPPAEVLAATAEYRRAEDDLADFLEEKCIICADSFVTAKSLYGAFKDWYTDNVSNKPPSQKRFGDAMSRRFGKDKNGAGGTNRYLGLELRSSLV
jgi:putative DNA primase/helicase